MDNKTKNEKIGKSSYILANMINSCVSHVNMEDNIRGISELQITIDDNHIAIDINFYN